MELVGSISTSIIIIIIIIIIIYVRYLQVCRGLYKTIWKSAGWLILL